MQRYKPTRSLEEQFEPGQASRLRLIEEAFLALRVRGRVSSYYLLEISRAIDRGMLLAAIHLATTLLEIWLRDLLVIRKANHSPVKSVHQLHELRWRMAQIDRDIEGVDDGLRFGSILKELQTLGVLDIEEMSWLKETYKELRNPLHHGISGRIVATDYEQRKTPSEPNSKEEMLLANMLVAGPDDRINQFEQFVDYDIEQHLERIVNFLANHQIPI